MQPQGGSVARQSLGEQALHDPAPHGVAPSTVKIDFQDIGHREQVVARRPEYLQLVPYVGRLLMKGVDAARPDAAQTHATIGNGPVTLGAATIGYYNHCYPFFLVYTYKITNFLRSVLNSFE